MFHRICAVAERAKIAVEEEEGLTIVEEAAEAWIDEVAVLTVVAALVSVDTLLVVAQMNVVRGHHGRPILGGRALSPTVVTIDGEGTERIVVVGTVEEAVAVIAVEAAAV